MGHFRPDEVTIKMPAKAGGSREPGNHLPPAKDAPAAGGQHDGAVEKAKIVDVVEHDEAEFGSVDLSDDKVRSIELGSKGLLRFLFDSVLPALQCAP